MRTFRFWFSSSGRLKPAAFCFAVAPVYAAGAMSHWLIAPDVIARSGLWAFAAVQGVLIWLWFALHAKRLRDAGRSVAPAVGVGLLYALSLVLLVIVVASFFNAPSNGIPDANAASALGLLLLASVIATLIGLPHYDLSWPMAMILTFMALVPVIVAVVFTVWAATRPRCPGSAKAVA